MHVNVNRLGAFSKSNMASGRSGEIASDLAIVILLLSFGENIFDAIFNFFGFRNLIGLPIEKTMDKNYLKFINSKFMLTVLTRL